MPSTHVTDVNLTPKNVSNLSSQDAIAAFFMELGYDTSRRSPLTADAIGLTGDSANAVRQIEVLSEDDEGFMRVVFVQLRSLTAKSRNDLARVLGKANVDHLLVLTSDFSAIEFVLLHKRRREVRGPAKGTAIQVVPLMVAVERKAPTTKELKTLRRFTWTSRDGLEQYDKLRSVFEAAAFTEEYFCNRALFADHYLITRLREESAWGDNPAPAFHAVRELLNDSRSRWLGSGEQIVREQLYQPLFELLGFGAKINKQSGDGQTKPDYLLTSKTGDGKTAAFVYAWDRWLDGPDYNLDQETPDENPGACVVSALEEGVAEWIIVTNGRQWRLYSKSAHSRATNFYEVDLAEALLASGDTDPNEAFRYWWLFFRSQAYDPRSDGQAGCWLDAIAEGSREYAKELGERLKDRVFVTIFPHLARGFLADRKQRLGIKQQPTDEELRDAFEATLTLLYRILFLLYAEARDLLPIREAPYREESLRKVKEEIADKAGIAESESAERITKAYSATEHSFYDRLIRLCAAMDKGDPALNVPIYNGGLFITSPRASGEGQGEGDTREQRIARFLAEHKVPDRYLALAIDRLARDPDDKTYSLVPIDYKSLEVRHLGSIYEGLLEFKLKVAEEDLATKKEKGKEKYIPISAAKPKRGKTIAAEVRKGDVYLSNDKAERKASGSYYTPDPIVEYIVENTVGPVLDEKLEKLRPEFRKVRKTFDNEVDKATAFPVKKPSGDTWDAREFAGEKTYTAHKQLVEQLFDFRVLDPAMGSGHFLVEAVDFITDRLLAFLNQFPVNPVTFMLDRTRKNILEALGAQGVAVDPDKLTEVNLLKRHVLKRCIYGVDLNPMAVELAKVSLWLDAFTIGAPLSFLDHHLRCGNSLVGATFKDLEAATKGQLFGIDYEPLLRAIRHVLHVNAMSDATAAEVKQSATEYGEARGQLEGYQIVLDLLVAKHFGEPDAPELLARGGSELRLHNRHDLMRSLADLNELAVVERVERIANQPHLRFFHWEVEFPEVFFGFADVNQRLLRHKNEIELGASGFNAIVGNPPYVRQEGLKEFKPYFKTEFSSYNSGADLFAFFFDRASLLLAGGGYLAFITSGSWLKASFGGPLRKCLAARLSLISAIDFGEWQPFPGAEMIRPTIVVFAHGRKSDRARILRHLTTGHPPTNLTDAVGRSPMIDVSDLSGAEWRLETDEVEALFRKMCADAQPLGEVVSGKLYRGIITGLTEAFVVEAETRDRLCVDRECDQLLRPYLEGKHLIPWRIKESALWVIAIPKGFTREHCKDLSIEGAELWFRQRYPQLYEWLEPFRTKAISRQDQGDYWWELRACDYFPTFRQPKIMWPDISKLPRFSCDIRGHVLGNTAYFLPSDDPFLLGVLASWATWFAIGRVCQPLRLRGGRWQYRLFSQFMERVPIPRNVSGADRCEIGRLAIQVAIENSQQEIEDTDPDDFDLRRYPTANEDELNSRVFSAFHLSDHEISLLRQLVAS